MQKATVSGRFKQKFMAKPNESGKQSKPLFGKRFRGYDAHEVDSFLDQVLKEVAQLQMDLAESKANQSKLSIENKGLTEQCVNSAMELGKVKVALEERNKEIEALSEEKNRLEEKAKSTDEILRAAYVAAEKMKSDAQIEASEIISDAESRAARAIEEMRMRMKELQDEMSEMRLKYRQFLSDAKELTVAMQRQISQSLEI